MTTPRTRDESRPPVTEGGARVQRRQHLLNLVVAARAEARDEEGGRLDGRSATAHMEVLMDAILELESAAASRGVTQETPGMATREEAALALSRLSKLRETAPGRALTIIDMCAVLDSFLVERVSGASRGVEATTDEDADELCQIADFVQGPWVPGQGQRDLKADADLLRRVAKSLRAARGESGARRRENEGAAAGEPRSDSAAANYVQVGKTIARFVYPASAWYDVGDLATAAIEMMGADREPLAIVTKAWFDDVLRSAQRDAKESSAAPSAPQQDVTDPLGEPPDSCRYCGKGLGDFEADGWDACAGCIRREAGASGSPETPGERA